MVGVDASAEQIAAARARGLYARVVNGQALADFDLQAGVAFIQHRLARLQPCRDDRRVQRAVQRVDPFRIAEQSEAV